MHQFPTKLRRATQKKVVDIHWHDVRKYLILIYMHTWNSTSLCSLTNNWWPFWNHETLYGVGCFNLFNLIFSTISLETRFSVLPLLITTLQHFPPTLQTILNKVLLYASLVVSLVGFNKTLFIIKASPDFGTFSAISTYTFDASGWATYASLYPTFS